MPNGVCEERQYGKAAYQEEKYYTVFAIWQNYMATQNSRFDCRVRKEQIINQQDHHRMEQCEFEKAGFRHQFSPIDQ